MSWGEITAATTCPSEIELAVWSPCNRFIAVLLDDGMTVDVLDSVTLQQLQTLEYPQGTPTQDRAVIFSPDSRILTCSSGSYMEWCRSGQELFVISWDLQTGGIASVIKWQGPEQQVLANPSITYSANGKTVGVFYCYEGHHNTANIFVCDVTSGVYMHSHSLNVNGILLPNNIWTHGESLRFLSAGARTITIWEVGFTSGATPTEVETLPAPDDFDPRAFHKRDTYGRVEGVQFFPTSCRLALDLWNGILVWDARTSKYLLHRTGISSYPRMSFSSDGHFFASSTSISGVYLWKESPTGYILHEILAPSTKCPNQLLSQDGESIVTYSGPTIRLWRTKSFTTSPPSIFTQLPQSTNNFILDFSPDGTLAVAAMYRDNTVMVHSLESGIPRLAINTSLQVYGLGVIGNTVVVIGDWVGDWKVIAWNIPARDFVPNTWVGVEDNSCTIIPGAEHPGYVTGASISPDSRYIALTVPGFLYIYSASTGERLWEEDTVGNTPWFAPDGCNVWCPNDNGDTEVWRVGGGKLEPRLDSPADIYDPPEGYPWGSSHGYWVTDDWWILDPDGKRLLMLPPPWQSYAVRRVWKGKFLALLHGGLSEPVILEVDL